MTPNVMPRAIARNLEFLAPKKKARSARPIRNTQMSDQLNNLNLKGTK